MAFKLLKKLQLRKTLLLSEKNISNVFCFFFVLKVRIIEGIMFPLENNSVKEKSNKNTSHHSKSLH